MSVNLLDSEQDWFEGLGKGQGEASKKQLCGKKDKVFPAFACLWTYLMKPHVQTEMEILFI